MAKSANDIIQIVRNATGRVDASDPQFTDQIILGYINDFYLLEMGEQLRLKENRTWWNFSIDALSPNPFPVDLENPADQPPGVQYTTIGPLVYINGFQCNWYEDPAQFYWRWPETQAYQPQRPIDVLYYNQELTFRGPPNEAYDVKINAYRVEVEMPLNGNISHAYLWRYVAYGAAIDLLSDYGEQDMVQRIMPMFIDYKAKVYARTYQQQMNQRSTPRF